MTKVNTKELTEKLLVSEEFNIRAQSNGYNVEVDYKPGLIPFYKKLFTISADMLPQLIDVLRGMQEALSQSKGGE